jgi:hypothetical protein
MFGFTNSIVSDRDNSSLGFVLVLRQLPAITSSRQVQSNLLALLILLILQCPALLSCAIPYLTEHFFFGFPVEADHPPVQRVHSKLCDFVMPVLVEFRRHGFGGCGAYTEFRYDSKKNIGRDLLK